MRLIESLGMGKEPALSEEQRDAIRRAAERFVRAGGRVTLAEWAALSEDERAALEEAAELATREALLDVFIAWARPAAPPAEQEALDGIMDRIERRRG